MKLASPGTAQSFVTASSNTRTRHKHQITARSLYRLRKIASNDYLTVTDEQNNEKEKFNLEDWCENRRQERSQFQFWHLVLSMKLVILLLIRSFTEAKFSLYCQSLAELLPYFCCKQQHKLCTIACHPPQRHGNKETETSSTGPRVREWEICYRQIFSRILINCHRSSP